MKKQAVITILAIPILLGLGWFVVGKKGDEKPDTGNITEMATTTNNLLHFTPIIPQTTISTDDWEIYQNEKFGFKVKYPPQYSIKTNSRLDEVDWKSATFLSIFDPKDTSGYEFHVIPVHVVLDKQPLIHGGEVYHTIDDFIQSGVQKIDAKKTDFVLINGMKTVHYQFEQDGAPDAPTEEYIFIKNDLLYRVFLNANNPYRDAIIQSVELQ